MRWTLIFIVLVIALFFLLIDSYFLFLAFFLTAIVIVIAKILTGTAKGTVVLGKELTKNIETDMEKTTPTAPLDEITQSGATEAGRMAAQLTKPETPQKQHPPHPPPPPHHKPAKKEMDNKGILNALHSGTQNAINWFSKIFE